MKTADVSLLLLLQRPEPDRPRVGPLAADLHHAVQGDRVLPYHELRPARVLVVPATVPLRLLEDLGQLEPRLRTLLPIEPDEALSVHVARLPGRHPERLLLFYLRWRLAGLPSKARTVRSSS